MKGLLTVLFAVAAAALLIVLAGPARAQNQNEADFKFLKEASEINNAEIHVGKLAEKQGTSDAVRKFGQRLQMDHSRMNDEVKAVAQKKGVNLADDVGPDGK